MSDSSQPAPATPFLPLENALSAVGSPVRWRILSELATGEQLMVAEIAERIGQNPDTTGKQLAVLRDAGIVTVGRNRLYRLQPQFIVDPAQRLVDLGWCLLRLNTGRA